MLGLQNELTESLLRKIAATAIANQAILKCTLAGVPLTIDNAIYFVGDFFDPEAEGAEALALEIEKAIAEVVNTVEVMRPGGLQPAVH